MDAAYTGNSGPIVFRALLEPGGPSFMPTQIVILPLAIVDALGGKTTRRAVGTLNGYPVRLGLQPMRTGERYLLINKEVCQKASVAVGQEVLFALIPDPDPDYVALPDELAEGLATWPAAQAAFDRLSGSVRRALARHIESAKRPETRAKRVVSVVNQLATGGHPFRPWEG